jgi:lactoylglutathione lyase
MADSIKGRFDHININVTDLQRSMDFYRKALSLVEKSRITAPDGSFIIVYLTDGVSRFVLELTWMRDHKGTYNLGDNETHLCLRVPGDYDEARRFHRAMGCICYENEEMGLYFINDPDDYWIEILPEK